MNNNKLEIIADAMARLGRYRARKVVTGSFAAVIAASLPTPSVRPAASGSATNLDRDVYSFRLARTGGRGPAVKMNRSPC